MRSIVLFLLALAFGLWLASFADAQDNAYLIRNPTTIATQNGDRYFANKPARTKKHIQQFSTDSNNIVKPALAANPGEKVVDDLWNPSSAKDASKIKASLPPVDARTRVAKASVNALAGQAAEDSPFENSLTRTAALPSFAVEDFDFEFAQNPRGALDEVSIKESFPESQAVPAVPSILRNQTDISPPKSQNATLPKAMSTDGEFYIPAITAATITQPSVPNVKRSRSLRLSRTKTARNNHRTNKHCDEWADFWECKPDNFDCPCFGLSSINSEGCGSRKCDCHSKCRRHGKAKHNRCGCGAGRTTTCDGCNRSSKGTCDCSKKSLRLGILTIKIDRK